MFALRVTQKDAVQYQVRLEGRLPISVHSWCALHDHDGNDMTLVIIDYRTYSLVKFELL